MSYSEIPTSDYLRKRTNKTLCLQLDARLDDMKQGLINAEYHGYGDEPERNWRFVYGADCVERITAELERRANNIW